MGVALSLALGAAEQLERSVGPSAALAAYRQLARTAGDEALRARATLGGLRCAARLADAAQLGALTELWRSAAPGPEGEAASFRAIVEVCQILGGRGILRAATDLAGAEVDRAPSARALYLLGRCLEAGEAPGAPIAYGRAEAAALEAPVDASAFVGARMRRLTLLAASSETLEEAVEAAGALATSGPAGALAPLQQNTEALEAFEAAKRALTPEERLTIASLRLRAPGRFARAWALAMLEELARDSAPGIRQRALLAAARHIDAWGPSLTEVEADRAAAVLGRTEDPAEREEARRRLALIRALASAPPPGRASALLEAAAGTPETRRLLARARALLFDDEAPPSFAPSSRGASSGLAEAALHAIAALRAGRSAEAERLLVVLSEEAARDAPRPVPAPAWTAASLGLDAAPTRPVAARLAALLLASRRGVPPRGFVDLARRLRAAGEADGAALAWRRAAEAREPGAAAELARDLLALAHRLAREAEALRARGGDPAEAREKRDRAASLLREARALASGARPGPARRA